MQNIIFGLILVYIVNITTASSQVKTYNTNMITKGISDQQCEAIKKISLYLYDCYILDIDGKYCVDEFELYSNQIKEILSQEQWNSIHDEYLRRKALDDEIARRNIRTKYSPLNLTDQQIDQILEAKTYVKSQDRLSFWKKREAEIMLVKEILDAEQFQRYNEIEQAIDNELKEIEVQKVLTDFSYLGLSHSQALAIIEYNKLRDQNKFDGIASFSFWEELESEKRIFEGILTTDQFTVYCARKEEEVQEYVEDLGASDMHNSNFKLLEALIDFERKDVVPLIIECRYSLIKALSQNDIKFINELRSKYESMVESAAKSIKNEMTRYYRHAVVTNEKREVDLQIQQWKLIPDFYLFRMNCSEEDLVKFLRLHEIIKSSIQPYLVRMEELDEKRNDLIHSFAKLEEPTRVDYLEMDPTKADQEAARCFEVLLFR